MLFSVILDGVGNLRVPVGKYVVSRLASLTSSAAEYIRTLNAHAHHECVMKLICERSNVTSLFWSHV